MTIELTSKWGCTLIVDDEDVDLLPHKTWIKSPNVYAASRGGKKLHRVVMERVLGRKLLPTETIDHQNLNKLDNRRSNLRLANTHQNTCNRGQSSLSKMPYKGIAYDKTGHCWRARVTVRGKTVYSKPYQNPLDAHFHYCLLAFEYHGEFSNFGANSPFTGWSITQLKKRSIIFQSIPVKRGTVGGRLRAA